MIDSGEIQEPAQPPDYIGFLRREIERANGEPIQLRKQTPDGELLFLQVSSVDYEPDPKDDFTKDGGLPGARNTTLVNIFAEKDGELTPIAHYNWLIRGNTAVGVANTPLQVLRELRKLNRTEAFQKAHEFWRRRGSFAVLPEYQRQGIASFILAVAIIMVDAKGATEIAQGLLLKDAVGVWRKFGADISELNDVSSLREPMPIAKVLQHPETTRIISEFT